MSFNLPPISIHSPHFAADMERAAKMVHEQFGDSPVGFHHATSGLWLPNSVTEDVFLDSTYCATTAGVPVESFDFASVQKAMAKFNDLINGKVTKAVAFGPVEAGDAVYWKPLSPTTVEKPKLFDYPVYGPSPFQSPYVFMTNNPWLSAHLGDDQHAREQAILRAHHGTRDEYVWSETLGGHVRIGAHI